MSYDAQEISVQGAAPIELYEFAHENSVYRYTSAEDNYTSAGSPDYTYTTLSIDRTAIESTPEQARNAVTLKLPRNTDIAELFLISPPSTSIAVTIRRVHRGDTSDEAIIWMGRVLNCEFVGASAQLRCEPITISLKRTGLRRLYTRNCSFVLYGSACGVNKLYYAASTTIESVSGFDLIVRALDSGVNYAGGFVEWVNGDSNTERRFIESQSLSNGSPDEWTLTLTQPFYGISASDSVTIYPGCDHTLSTCDATFSNSANYGGWPYIPTKNPFGGNPVF